MIHGYAHERFGRVADTFASQIDKTDGGASVALFWRRVREGRWRGGT